MLRKELVKWYHENLKHPGQKRMYLTMNKHYSWPKMRIDIERHVAACDTRQNFKLTTKKKYGKLSLKDNSTLDLFEDVQVDLIGPWRINIVQKS